MIEIYSATSKVGWIIVFCYYVCALINNNLLIELYY